MERQMSFSDSLRLDGRRALVTGASRGIGRAIAEAFADAGADVALAARTVPDLETVAASIKARGRRAVVLPLDVRDVAAVEGAVAKAGEALGGLDILVNNAGVYFHTSVDDLTPDQFQLVLDVNLRAAVFAMQAARPLMRAGGGGVVINISSVAGLMGTMGSFAYSASKWAVRGMTKSAAKELGRRNVRVNSVHPGYIDTEMLAQTSVFTEDDDRTRRVLRQVPLRRIAEPAEVGRVVLFLASDASSYCTGQEFTVDGGMFG